jgi:hypothetical protein
MNASLINGIFGEDRSMNTAVGSVGTMPFTLKGGVEPWMLDMDREVRGSVLGGDINVGVEMREWLSALTLIAGGSGGRMSG